MKYDKFFELARQAGIEEAELYISKSYAFTASLFHSELNSNVENSSVYMARGIINGKFGTASCDIYDNKKAQFLVDEIVKNAAIIENDDPAILFKGSEKYHRINSYNKKLGEIPLSEKVDTIYDLERKLKEIDERIIEVSGVEYSENESSVTLLNSHGLKLTQKLNYYVIYGGVVAKENEQTKTGYEIILGNDYSQIDVDKIARKAVDEALSQLGGEPVPTKKYKAALSPEVFGAFMNEYIEHANAEQVQKHSSLFIDKIGQKVASKKVTIEDKPIQKGSVFARFFDDEGVATYNKPIIKNGILECYLYNLTTACKDGVNSTGNGFKAGSKIGVSPVITTLKPGKKSKEELFAKIKDGVYITEVNGLHAGMNSQSGNFSLQASGFLIKDGKLDRALDVITVSGNLIDVMNDVVEIANDNKTLLGGTVSSTVYIKKLAVGGK